MSSSSFDGDYIPGTKTLVYSTSLLVVDQNSDWKEIVLDEACFYNGSDNLIIEIQ
ncbi:MAG: hypothetical protein KAH54_02365 [Candidatus Sabulitectum sp.]|nr:hypothetical protein [Candidatus Sabulitectum sp.]